jgi:putative transposase
MSSKI